MTGKSVRKMLVRMVFGNDPGSTRARQFRRLLRPARLRLFMMPTVPDGHRYGYFRGNSISRRWISDFLTRNQDLITGRCLEVGDARYIELLGGIDVTEFDILDNDPRNAQATVIGDLQDLVTVGNCSYDCVIATQVLQYLQDPSAGVREIHRILAPGGSALVTVPAMGVIDPNNIDRWRFMPLGVRDLFAPYFGHENIVVDAFGNLLSGLAVWAGLAQEDLPRKTWRFDDPIYPVVITIRATRRFLP